MIEVNIVGQLGNQLFEYACARQLQEKYGGKIYLNTYEMRQNTPNFRLALLDFNLNENVEVVSERPLKEANADNYSVKILRKFFPDLYFNMMAKKGVFVWKSARIYKPLPLLNEKLHLTWRNVLLEIVFIRVFGKAKSIFLTWQRFFEWNSLRKNHFNHRMKNYIIKSKIQILFALLFGAEIL